MKCYATTKYGWAYHKSPDGLWTICGHRVDHMLDSRSASVLSWTVESVARAVSRGLFCGNCARERLTRFRGLEAEDDDA